MKNFFHKIMSISMALLLMASTISWKVEKHYCMGQVMDISFFTPAQDCGMDMDLKSDVSEKIKLENLCCDDEVIFVAGQDNPKVSNNDLSLDQQLFIFAYVYSYANLFEFEEVHNLPNEHYPPPIIVKDIHLLDAVFLI